MWHACEPNFVSARAAVVFDAPVQWQAAVHFRPAFAHAHFLQAPSLHLHPPFLAVRRRFFWAGISPHRRSPGEKEGEVEEPEPRSRVTAADRARVGTRARSSKSPIKGPAPTSPPQTTGSSPSRCVAPSMYG